MSTTVLKLIALLSMALDHTGAVLFPQAQWMRIIGRLAFPIYCFCLVEGYRHTSSVPRYLARLGLFALLSEIPFDLALTSGFPDWSHQNVFFTLSMGLAVVWMLDAWSESLPVAAFLGAVSFIAAAELLQTDYGAFGVLLILLFAVCGRIRRPRLMQIAAFCACTLFCYWGTLEQYAVAAALPIGLYNGKKGGTGRGRWLRWLFYWFYPLHLAILWAVRFFWAGAMG